MDFKIWLYLPHVSFSCGFYVVSMLVKFINDLFMHVPTVTNLCGTGNVEDSDLVWTVF